MQTISSVADCGNVAFDEWSSDDLASYAEWLRGVERILTPEPVLGSSLDISPDNPFLKSRYQQTVEILASDLPEEERERLCWYKLYLERRLGLHEVESVKAWNEYVHRQRLDDDGTGICFAHLNKPVSEFSTPIGKFTHEPKAVPAFDAIELQIGGQDVVIRHRVIGSVLPNHAGGGKRGRITKLSKQSVKRMKLFIRNLPEGSIKSMLTLTYPKEFPLDGELVKRHHAAIRKYLTRQGVGAAWFQEFQKRGALHFHMFLSGWPREGVKGVADAWYRIVGSGDQDHLRWHLGELSGRPCLEWMRKPHAASAYATKYATKLEQKDVPLEFQNVGRFWGVFGNTTDKETGKVSRFRPVWRFVSGSGSYCVEATHRLVDLFRSQFSDDRWKPGYFVSTTLWGGAGSLDALLFSVGWTPF